MHIIRSRRTNHFIQVSDANEKGDLRVTRKEKQGKQYKVANINWIERTECGDSDRGVPRLRKVRQQVQQMINIDESSLDFETLKSNAEMFPSTAERSFSPEMVIID